MIKISNTPGMIDLGKQTALAENTEIHTKQFKTYVRDAEKTNQNEYINTLKEKIEKQGIILSQRADLCELQRYRSMISEFLSEAIKGAFSFEKNNFFDSRGRHQILSDVKKVNEKLDELAAELISREQDNLKIADLIEDIRGLIFDITV